VRLVAASRRSLVKGRGRGLLGAMRVAGWTSPRTWRLRGRDRRPLRPGRPPPLALRAALHLLSALPPRACRASRRRCVRSPTSGGRAGRALRVGVALARSTSRAPSRRRGPSRRCSGASSCMGRRSRHSGSPSRSRAAEPIHLAPRAAAREVTVAEESLPPSLQGVEVPSAAAADFDALPRGSR